MRKRYVQVKTKDGWELIDAALYSPPEKELHYVIGDIEPYTPVAGPEAIPFLKGDHKNAKQIGGRRQHREYLRRNGFIEVGNEKKAFLKYNGKSPDNPTRGWGGASEAEFRWQNPDDRVRRGK